MPHAPSWHLVDNAFTEADKGISVPQRNTSSGAARLEITNLDHSDPPNYRPGGVPRDPAFNRNVFFLTPDPCMPAIPVELSVSGFDPKVVPVEWRLVCRHVLCRHTNIGQFRYRGSCAVLEREWRGQAHAATFTIFGPSSPDCQCTYSDETRIQGGHALLVVAARTDGTTLLDYVHLRIAGTNPMVESVLRYVDEQLEGYHPNVLSMVHAIYEHESGFRQFSQTTQSRAAMTFRAAHHKNSDPGNPDCRVVFDWPDDPERFPLASFDFGVGLSQFTQVGGQKVTSEIAWDWRENIRMSANLFLGKLKSKYKPGLTWRHWAMDAWAAYNGSGAAAERYAQALAMSPEGAKVPVTPVDALPEIALIRPPAPLAAPGDWVVLV